ncbi:hypothetical protein C8J56DRAFT_1113717 [Mycena floridula]|nr:hypothetical protein C8J56DRAFT_1113717 [Mycena floridula]
MGHEKKSNRNISGLRNQGGPSKNHLMPAPVRQPCPDWPSDLDFSDDPDAAEEDEWYANVYGHGGDPDILREQRDEVIEEEDGERHIIDWDKDLDDEVFCEEMMELAQDQGDDADDEDWVPANVQRQRKKRAKERKVIILQVLLSKIKQNVLRDDTETLREAKQSSPGSPCFKMLQYQYVAHEVAALPLLTESFPMHGGSAAPSPDPTNEIPEAEPGDEQEFEEWELEGEVINLMPSTVPEIKPWNILWDQIEADLKKKSKTLPLSKVKKLMILRNFATLRLKGHRKMDASQHIARQWHEDEGVHFARRSELSPQKFRRALNKDILPSLNITLAKDLCERTACRWLVKLGFRRTVLRKGIYKDGHDCDDVKKYRDKEFLPKMEKLEARMTQYQLVNGVLEGTKPTLGPGEREVILGLVVPEAARGMKSALELHVRLLWRAYEPSVVPLPPTAEFKQKFSARFKDLKSVEERRGSGPTVIERASSYMLDSLRHLPAKGKIARGLRRLNHNHIATIFSYLANYGFTAWTVDLTETPTSLWNIACKNVAIDSFKQAMASHAYAFLSPNHDYLNNQLLLSTIYDQFVWTYMKGLHELELREPGGAATKAIHGDIYKRRKAIADQRAQWARNENYPDRICDQLADTNCTSEDEKVGNDLIIKSKPGCSRSWTDFKAKIDTKVIAQKELSGHSAQAKKLRHRGQPGPGIPQKRGEFNRLPDPDTTTLDFFDVEYFNQLPMQLRYRYTNCPVALPENDSWFFNEDGAKEGRDWKRMSDKKFMRKYGAAIVEKLGYNLPTDDDMADAAAESDEMDDDTN